jgi:hypothetical protein
MSRVSTSARLNTHSSTPNPQILNPQILKSSNPQSSILNPHKVNWHSSSVNLFMSKLMLSAYAISMAALSFASGADAAIRKVHNAFEAAMNKNDFEAAKNVVRANFAPEFKVKSKQGEQNLAGFIANLAPPNTKVTSFHFTLGKITEKGNSATLQSTVHFNGIMTPPKGKPQKLSATETDAETWTKVKGVWKMTHMDEVSVKTK